MPESGDPSSQSSHAAYLEGADGEIFSLESSISFGRSDGNTIVLPTEGVSRNHATIHCGGHREYWLVDLGSRNGTKLNGQRISQPARLHDNDLIEVAEHQFHFFCPAGDPSEAEKTKGPTRPIRQTTECRHWILIADIRDFTGLSQRLSGENLLEFVDRWIKECQPVVEGGGARFVKFLGDGFFAVMPDTMGAETRVAEIVRGLAAISARGSPSFRIVVHQGMVAVGGAPLLNEESFIGADVNFAFRMEKVTDTAGATVLLSEPAAARLRFKLTLIELPCQKVKGFDAEHRFFGVEFPK